MMTNDGEDEKLEKLRYRFTMAQDCFSVRPKEDASASRTVWIVALRVSLVLGLTFVVTLACLRLIASNATTVGFVYLVEVLVLASAWGLWEGILASAAATLCFNYFFIPPVSTFTIADSRNWVALTMFLVTAVTVSELSNLAKQRTRDAVDRRWEMERLYALSRAILLTDSRESAARQIARRIAQTFALPAVALYERQSGEIHQAGSEDLPDAEDKLREVATQGTSLQDAQRRIVVVPIRLGSEPIGSLAIRDVSLSETAFQSLCNLVAIGLEKARAQEAASRAEASRQSEELKSTLMDAIAHQFKTPLTSIKAATTALLSETAPESAERRELISIADEGADRLARLVTEALQMARIESGELRLNRELHSAASLISSALAQMKPLTEGRSILVQAAADVPLVYADADLIQLAITQLVDNALKYSPPASPLIIESQAAPEGVLIRVSDHGPGIPEKEQEKIFERFYRRPGDRRRVPGTGMGLAIVREILAAHRGTITVKSAVGGGSEFLLTLPLAPEEKIA